MQQQAARARRRQEAPLIEKETIVSYSYDVGSGSKKRPFFRVVVTEAPDAPRDSSFVESLGLYNPRRKPECARSIASASSTGWRRAPRPSSTVRTLVARHPGRRGCRRPPRRPRRERRTPRRARRPAGARRGDRPGAGRRARRGARHRERSSAASTVVELFMAPGDIGQHHWPPGTDGRRVRDAGGAGGGARQAARRSARVSRRVRSEPGDCGDGRLPAAGGAGAGRARSRARTALRGDVVVNPETDFVGGTLRGRARR